MPAGVVSRRGARARFQKDAEARDVLEPGLDGTLWFGDELGPFLLHTDATGRLLAPPSPSPSRRLRGLGLRRRLVGARRPTAGWAALTESELAVGRLVADGLTNRAVAERLYGSPHTVGGHLRRAFGKLSVNSRVGLTRVVAEHGTGAGHSYERRW